MFKTIKAFILMAAAIVSLLVFILVYLFIANIYDEKVRHDARTVSNLLAQQTFNSMFQIMRRGWTRAELEKFLDETKKNFNDTPYDIEIYRGPVVEALFGEIDQPDIDARIGLALQSGLRKTYDDSSGVSHVFPLVAREECLRCHVNASVGNVLGAISVRQDLSLFIVSAERGFLQSVALITPIPILFALFVAFYLNRRINSSIAQMSASIERVNRVSDLKDLKLAKTDLGFQELNQMSNEVFQLAEKLKSFAVDKDLLEFQIRLHEKFVITSDVIKDERRYISELLCEINKEVEVDAIFSLFRVDKEDFELEIIWHRCPDDRTKRIVLSNINGVISNTSLAASLKPGSIKHMVADGADTERPSDLGDMFVYPKELHIEQPNISGIVGAVSSSEIGGDDVRRLVMESILSTLINVMGSVRAIEKYTRDLEFYASRDPLTGLYNQRVFWELLDHEIQRSKRNDEKFAVLVVDLDNFKTINDTYGHSTGDMFLQEFSTVILPALRGGDVLARYGGDEFVIILPNVDEDTPSRVGARILQRAHEFSALSPAGVEIRATVSVGIALYPTHACEARDLFIFADNMMYRAKSEGKDRLGIPSESDVVDIFRELGERNLVIRQAVDEDRLFPVFHPIVEPASGNELGAEVLCRIAMEDGSILEAKDFIELAERSGIIQRIDLVIIEKGLKQAALDNYQGMLFFNLSPKALMKKEFTKHIGELVTRMGADPQRIVFEITERDTVGSIAMLENFIEELRGEGFKFAIDDFGSGFSSFQYVKRLPVDFIKIDGEFVSNMCHNRQDMALVKSISSLARELEIKTIAEYVETEAVLAAVKAVGIDFAQGHLVGQLSETLSETADHANPGLRSIV